MEYTFHGSIYYLQYITKNSTGVVKIEATNNHVNGTVCKTYLLLDVELLAGINGWIGRYLQSNERILDMCGLMP